MNHDEIRAQHDAMKAALEANAWAEYVFCRSWMQWRKADKVMLCGSLTVRVVATPLGVQPVRRESGGVLR